MFIYILLFIFLTWGIIVYDFSKFGKYRKPYYIYCCIALLLIVTFSYKIGTDTFSYLPLFYQYPTFGTFKFTEILTYKCEPFWVLLNISIRSIWSEFCFLHLIVCLLLNIPIYKIFYEQSKHPFSCLLLYYLTIWITCNFESLRQSCAMGFYLWGCMALIKDNQKGFLLRAWPMILFHKTGIIVYILTFMTRYIKINKILLYCLFVLLIISLTISSFFEKIIFYINIFSSDQADIYESYLNSEQQGVGNEKNVLGCIFPLLLNIIIPSYMMVYYKRNGVIWLSRLLLIFVFFSILQFSFIIFKRLMEYTYIFMILGIINLTYLKIRERRVIPKCILSLSILCIIYISNINYFRPASSYDVNGLDIRYFPYRSVFDEDKELPARNARLNRTDISIMDN